MVFAKLTSHGGNLHFSKQDLPLGCFFALQPLMLPGTDFYHEYFM